MYGGRAVGPIFVILISELTQSAGGVERDGRKRERKRKGRE